MSSLETSHDFSIFYERVALYFKMFDQIPMD